MRNGLRQLTAALLAAGLLAACSTSEASPAPTPEPPRQSTTTQAPAPRPNVLKPAHERRSPGVVAEGGRGAPYNYAPAVLAEGGRYRMWWCSQLDFAGPPGDDILLAESSSLDGGFADPAPVFSGSTTGFDAVHVCDPSVIKVGGTYYLYYTGWGGEEPLGNTIGLATSPDGRVWTRADRPVLGPSREVLRANTYGAGQPTAVYLDGWFYLMFIDTSGRAASDGGSGQFLLRAKDPRFTTGVQALGPEGFRPDTTGSRQRSVADVFGADLMWVDALSAFAIAYEITEGTTVGTRIVFWDKDFRTSPYPAVMVSGPWREGPGLVRRPDGHAPVPLDNPCETVPLDLIRGSREGEAGPTDLMHFGLDLTDVGACRDPGTTLAVLDGFGVPSPLRTVDLIRSGRVIRIDRRSVAEALATRILDYRVRMLDAVPVAAQLPSGVPARSAPGRGVGLLVDDRLWMVPSAAVAVWNSSPLQEITPDSWDAYRRGPDLMPPAR
jgi:hypothetical protein